MEFPAPLPAERRGDHWWVEVGGRELRLSNLTKVFWAEEGYTKGDLIAYYLNAAPHLLPYLADRPLTMKRMPDGAAGSFFYEKSAPSHAPDWLPRCRVPTSGDGSRWGSAPKNEVIDYLMVEDAGGLCYMANLACIEFHPLHSRCGSVDEPDYLFFDLDPFEPATFQDVLAVARLVHVSCEQLGLAAHPKTSGATGVQIYVPLRSGFTYEECRGLVGAVGRLMQRADPDRVTMEWQIERRAGKVFVDHNMNRPGANIAAVYSLRPEPGAPVSTPLEWDEVEEGAVRPRDFTIESIWERLEARGDLFRAVLDEPQDIGPALEALGVPRTAREDAPTRSQEAIARSRDPNLREYLGKRTFGTAGTKEPEGGGSTPTGDSFVIQWHDATRLHHDFRLEHDGVLVSWAVPKGLPFEKGVKRLAAHVEDHPMEYGSFEGSIPKGHYGAGDVRIWDRGRYDLLEWTDSKVSVRLHGERHSGEYHLVKTKLDWLIFLSKPEGPAPEAPPAFSPMLAESAKKAFDRKGWVFEPKLDGVRMLVYLDGQAIRLVSRTSRNRTDSYPELDALYRRIVAVNAVIDGEVVATDPEGRPSFEVLQGRMNLASKAEITRAAKATPVELYAFDLLWLDGQDLTARPLAERRELLERVALEGRGLRVVPQVAEAGLAFFEQMKQLGLEGIIAKRAGGRYQPGRRSADWVKVKAVKSLDAVVLGWTPGQRGRAGTFGALLLGAHRQGDLAWIGQVGTGFTDRMLADLRSRLQELEADRPAVDDLELIKVKGARWTRPEMVVEVEYLEITGAGKLRAPSFKRIRLDAAPEQCLVPA